MENNIQNLLPLIEQFVKAESMPEKFQLITDNPQLLSEQVEPLFYYLMETEPNEQSKRTLREHQQLLSQCRTEGVEAAFAKRISNDTQILIALIEKFVKAESMPEKFQLVTDNPQLLSEQVEPLFYYLMETEPNEQAKRTLREHQQLLSQCRTEGIEAAFASRVSPNIPPELPAILNEIDKIRKINDIREMPKRIALCQQALTYVSKTSAPPLWAQLQDDLGSSYAQNPLGDQADNLEKAIECLKAALQVRTRQEMPVDWATTMNNLANAYFYRIRGTRADNQEKGIECLKAALQVRTQQDLPVDWAGTMNNLANAYLYRIRGTQADNTEKAIECLKAALQVTTQSALPVEWAQTMNNLANAYIYRIRGTRADNLEKAIECYQAALPVRTQQALPVDWAATMNNLALAYSDRIRGTRADNLEKAIACYQDVLQVFTCEAMPHNHRLAQRNLGTLYFNENHWQSAHTAYAAALQTTETLFTTEEGSAEGRQTELQENKGLAAPAAYCLAKLSHFEEAVETLEQGRTRAFSETYNSALLKMASATDQQAFADTNEQLKTLEQEMNTAGQENTRTKEAVLADLKTARTQLSTIIETISQTVPDFMPAGLNFQSIAMLATTLNQPLVYLLTTSKGSLALMVRPDLKGVENLGVLTEAAWLDEFTEEDLNGRLYNSEDDDTPHYLHSTVLAEITALKSLLQQILPQLNQQLLNPVVTRLTELGYSQAVLIPMDTLNLLPLHVSTDFTFSLAPSARLLQAALNKTQPYADAPLSLLGIANPTANSQKPLYYSQLEVADIAALFPQQQQFHQQAATRTALVSALNDQTHLHFSCHGLFDMDDPPNSALYLAGEDRLTVKDLIIGTVDLTKTQLVVLSACQTGITDFTKAPNEVTGFPAAFMQAGVPAIISTLWPVTDISTMLLLKQFYHYHLNQNQPPAHALQRAQQWLRHSTAEQLQLAESCRQTKQYAPKAQQNRYEHQATYYEMNAQTKPFADPYYWAGFVFSGYYLH
jgi:CHAT domain-containing protein